MPSWHRLLWQCRQWPVSAAVSEHTVPKNYLKYKNKTGKEALPFITEFLETTECLGTHEIETGLQRNSGSEVYFPTTGGYVENREAGDIPEKTPQQRSNLVYTSSYGEGVLNLHKEAMQHANRGRGRLSSRSGDLGLRSSWSLVNYTQDFEIKCANQMRDHPPVIHRAAGKSKPCTWGGLCQVRADYKMSPDDEAFSLNPLCEQLPAGTTLHRPSLTAPAYLYRLHTSTALAVCLETYLRPYSLQMAVFCAMLISISSDRLCFQCRRSESFRASISLLAVFPAKALC